MQKVFNPLPLNLFFQALRSLSRLTSGICQEVHFLESHYNVLFPFTHSGCLHYTFLVVGVY